jgi:hypothetical protein
VLRLRRFRYPKPPMLTKPWTVVLAVVLAVVAVIGCTNLNYNCVGICGISVGNGDFEGTVQAETEDDALTQCLKMFGCDAGFQPSCSCYLVQ